MPAIAIITIVWGRDYVDFYKDHVLPYTRHVLPEGFLIVCGTTTEHVDELRSVADVVFDCGFFSGGSKYDFASTLDRYVMRTLYENGARRFVYQNPDAIVSKEAFLRIKESKSSVMTLPGIRIWREFFFLIYKGFDDELLDNALTVLHPVTLSVSRRGGYRRFRYGFSSVVYDISQERVRCQALHRHPLMFDIPEDYDWDLYPSGTVDDVFLQTLGHPRSAFDNLTSSEQGYVLEFSPTSLITILGSYPPECNVDIDAAIAEFAASDNCSDLHRWFLETEYEWRPRLKTGEARGENP
ncbi:MAG: hypothetical protein ACK5T8_04275 [Alphaproteobacteria bacterium]